MGCCISVLQHEAQCTKYTSNVQIKANTSQTTVFSRIYDCSSGSDTRPHPLLGEHPQLRSLPTTPPVFQTSFAAILQTLYTSGPANFGALATNLWELLSPIRFTSEGKTLV